MGEGVDGEDSAECPLVDGAVGVSADVGCLPVV